MCAITKLKYAITGINVLEQIETKLNCTAAKTPIRSFTIIAENPIFAETITVSNVKDRE